MTRSNDRQKPGTQARPVMDDLGRALTLQATALDSPIFHEPWTAGSPLDWNEFVHRWRTPGTASRHRIVESEG